MSSRRLDDRLDYALERIWGGVLVLREGIDTVTPLERLEWIRAAADEAIYLQRKIERRDRRRAAS